MLHVSLIKGKKIALVGPAQYMTNSNLGQEIDAHDVVIRLNRGYELVDKYSSDIGSKTDVLYSCLIERSGNAGNLDPLVLKKKHNIKMIIAPPHSDFSGISRQTKFHDLVNLRKVKEISSLIPIRIVDHKFHTDLALKVNCKPNTGFMAIYDLLQLEPSSLSIYGFSFYLDGFMEGCKTGIQQEEGKTEQQFADKCFLSKRHIQENMWQYAKDTLVADQRIKLDSVLDKILGLKSFDRGMFAREVV